MFLDQVPPDTSSYMVAGYAIFFIITAVYLVSLFVRNRNLNRDMNMLEGIAREDAKPKAVQAAVEKSNAAKAARASASKPPMPRKAAAAQKTARKTATGKKTATRKIPRKK